MSNIFGIHEEETDNDYLGLYPNYLSGRAKTNNTHESGNGSLSIEDICMSLVMRGGFTEKYKDLLKHVRQFLNEVTYQLNDGYAINTGYFFLHPNIYENFNSKNDCPVEN